MQHVSLVVANEQRRAKERPARQIERLAGRHTQLRVECFVANAACEGNVPVPRVAQLARFLQGRNDLTRRATGIVEARAQYFMATHERIERAFDGAGVERTR